jgi:hypothetical protein
MIRAQRNFRKMKLTRGKKRRIRKESTRYVEENMANPNFLEKLIDGLTGLGDKWSTRGLDKTIDKSIDMLIQMVISALI